MASFDMRADDLARPPAGGRASVASHRGPDPTAACSILFAHPESAAVVDLLDQPDFFPDLNLDQLVEGLVTGRDWYDLDAFFFTPLHEVSDVEYRHEVLRDLEKADVRDSVTRFAESMRQMRDHLEQVEKLHYRLQKDSWFLDTVQIYCAAVRSLTDELGERDLTSPGLQGLRDYLTRYAASARFTSLVAEIDTLKDALSRVQYAVRINGARVTVTRYSGEADYSAQISDTFAKFAQGEANSYLVSLSHYTDMNHVEAQVLDGVARLFPDVFETRANFCTSNADYLDPTIGRFDREVQFYLAFLELVARLRAAGLPFCYPQVSANSKEIAAEETFDIALAAKLVSEGAEVISNDFHLTGPERMFVVSGPNNGGKTTFSRTVGQMHYLASLGLLVPGRAARLFLPDRIFTHFERAEDIETLRGKFDDELVRVHDIVERATSDSVIVMNESFNSTSLSDALFVGTEVIRRILDLGCLGVYVTFVDEISTLSDATVSMVSQIVPDNPAQRTFKVIRTPADGRAYAWAIAEKYGLSYQRLMERIGT